MKEAYIYTDRRGHSHVHERSNRVISAARVLGWFIAVSMFYAIALGIKHHLFK